MVSIALFFIKTYQILLSPDKGVLFSHRVCVCRFYPSCSEYTINALQKHGFFIGIYYGLRRVLRCNPFRDGGYDPVE